MNYDRGYCEYECDRCLKVCPSGAISRFPLETKKKIKIGSSELNKDLCIPFVSKRDCAACQEQCPTGAITMEPRGNTRVPVLNDDYCIGCGSCQYACPVKPVRAILVKPKGVHSFAFNPRQQGPKARKKGLQYIPKPEKSEFPF
jgi:ferredoxin